MIEKIFFDNEGIFQWVSVTTIVSVFVLITQVMQFFYQNNKIKKMKSFDIMIDFRIDDLRRLKAYVIDIDQYLSREIVYNTGEPLVSADSLTMVLNVKNKNYKELMRVFNEYTLLYSNSLKKDYKDGEELILKMFELSQKFIEEYKKYENYEIEMIKKYT